MHEINIIDTEDVGNNEVWPVRMNSRTRVKGVWQSGNNIAKLLDELKSRWRRINRISCKFYWNYKAQFSCSVISNSLQPYGCQASLSITNSWSLLKLMSIKSVIPSNHLLLCHPRLLLPSIFPSIRVFSNESALHIRWPTYRSFSFSIPSGSARKESACNAADLELGKSPRGGNGNPLQYSYLENSMDSPEEPGGLQFMDLQRVGQNYRVRT